MDLVVFFIVLFLSCTGTLGESNLQSASINFSVNLLHSTLQNVDRNAVISPYMIWSLLMSVAYDTSGNTREQIHKVLSLPEEREQAVREFRNLRSAVLMSEDASIFSVNYLFYDNDSSVYVENLQRLEKDFRFICKGLNFGDPQRATDAALRNLRSYGSSVRNILRSDDFMESTMIIGSSISFTAQWSKPFKISNTVKHHYVDGDKETTFKLMHVKARFRTVESESLQAFVTELPYEGDQHCMLLLRPLGGRSVQEVVEGLRGVSMPDLLLELQPREVEVELPQRGTNEYVLLNIPLSKMGLSDIFDRNFANFNDLTSDKVHIGEFTHRVSVINTEAQTIVYSTTPAFDDNSGPQPKLIPMERPYIFLIVSKPTATILFGGLYTY